MRPRMWVPLFLALLACIGLFRLRNSALAPAIPLDGRWQGYTPADVRDFLDVIGLSGRQLYGWTELTLDLVFPLLYGALLSALIARTILPGRGRHTIWLPWLAAIFDYGENGILAYLAWTFNGRPSRLASIANVLTRGKWVFITLAVLALAIGSVYTARRWLSTRMPYMYLLRVPLLLALTLIALPVLARTGLRNAFGSMFVLGPLELVWVSFTAVLGAATILATARVVLLYGADRFGVASLHPPKELPLWQPLVGLAIAGWMIGFALWGSIVSTFAAAIILVFAALGGTGAGVAFVWLCEALRFWWAQPHPATVNVTGGPRMSSVPDLVVPARFMPRAIHRRSPPSSATRLARNIVTRARGLSGAPGYVDPRTGKLLSGHVAALVFLAGLLIVYVAGFYADFPHAERGSKVPALVYLMALLTLPTWAFAAAAFFLDRYRMPVLVVPLMLLLVSFVFPTDHFFPTRPRPLTPPSPARRAEPADLVLHLDGCRLTAVAASGGGIRASGWAAQVLTGLHREVPDFTRSLRLVSAVSGGSVGAMYFVGAFNGPNGPPDTALGSILELSMRSSLNDVAWGFAYPDLWRTFTPFVSRRATDRAWALEQAWARGWPARDETLRQWRDQAAAGLRPAVAFNATLVETGQRLALGSFDTPPGATMQTLTFEDVYGTEDISVVTAARLSATFTYVTPVARARKDDLAKWHVADGGYQDNYGVATLVDWLDAALFSSETTPADEVGACGDRLRIAVVRIGAHEEQVKAGNRSWAFQIGAPMQVLLAIRTAGPKARNEMELELLARAGLGARLGIVCFDYESDDSPLSWHLSDEQRRRIAAAWHSPVIQRQRQKLYDFLHGDGKTVFACG